MKRTGRKVIALALIVAFALMAMGCKQTHINNVPEENQAVENVIRNSAVTMKAISVQHEAIVDAAIDAYLEKKISQEDFNTVVEYGFKFDKVFNRAGKALLKLRKNVDSGIDPDTAAIETAIGELKNILLEMEE